MRLNEIFNSIQGEGIHAGEPTTFIRLQGCNLQCSWCDPKYAQDRHSGETRSIDSILEEVKALPRGWICITGGEPLLQQDELSSLLGALKRDNYRIEIETNGSIALPSWARWGTKLVDSWVVDYKPPSSGVFGHHAVDWRVLTSADQLKFVVKDSDDLKVVVDASRTLVGSYPKTRPQLLVSPIVNYSATEWCRTEGQSAAMIVETAWLQEVAQFCIENGMRLSLQLHKIIYGDRRGV